jgi:predicted nucleic acid-binding protein
MPGEPEGVPAEQPSGLVDTNILILQHLITPGELPETMAISAVTLAELAAGVHQTGGPDESAERARRLDLVPRVENSFVPIPFDSDAARMFGRIAAAV